MTQANNSLFLTTSQAAELLRVHPSTMKRWCNDGELPVEKTRGGHRRIHLRSALTLARRRSLATFLDDFRPYEAHVWSGVVEALSGGGFYTLNSLAMGWIMRGHTERVGRLVLELLRHPGLSLEAVFDDMVREVMRAVGEAWRTGRLRVGEEHMTTEAILEALVQFRYELSPPSSPGRGAPPPPQAVVGTMEGVRHHLGSMCIRLVLEREGWTVHYLGPDVPVEDFAAVQRSREADLVCVSFSGVSSPADYLRCTRLLQELYHPSRPYRLALGGSSPDEKPELPMAGPFISLGVLGSAREFSEWLRADPTEGAGPLRRALA